MPSIEAAFIGLARYIRDHFPHLTWMPLWYGGIPFPDCYPPLLHSLVAATSGISHLSIGLAYHAVTAVTYSLGPVALYWAARRLGAARVPAFLASLGYSLLSPSIWLVPELRRDIGGWFAPCRLDAMVRWGEGPHVTSLTLLPLALGCLHIALQRRHPARYFAAAIAIALVALCNWIGAFALALVIGAYLLSRVGALLLTAAIGCWAYAIAAPFFTPSTIATIQANAPILAGGYKPNHPLEAAFLAGALALAWAVYKAHLSAQRRFAILLVYITAAITLCAFWFKLEIIPQPQRYHLEMDQAFWLAVALSVGQVANLRRIANPPLILAAILLSLPIALHQHARAQEIEKPIAIQSTVEYKISTWLGANLPNQRVFAPGTIGFWMLPFSDTPTLTGGFDNGMRNTFLQDVNYQVYAGDSADTMFAWLKAFGVSAVIGAGPQSHEYYHPYAHSEKFNGLPEIWRDGGDAIYPVPRRRTSLAHAMLASDLVAQRPPAYYPKPLETYLTALDDPSLPDATFTWRTTASAVITGTFQPQHILSVQITWDNGWHATVNNQPRRIWQDKLGQVAIEPLCKGPCTVELTYDGGIEQQAARWLSALALLAGIGCVVHGAATRRQ